MKIPNISGGSKEEARGARVPLIFRPGPKTFFLKTVPPPPPYLKDWDPALNIVSRSSICCMCCGVLWLNFILGLSFISYCFWLW